MKQIWFLILGVVAVSGCATLNKSECLNANWRMIGMEDGAKGRLPDYIGKHRSACSKYNVTPDLDEYKRGHEEGLRQFCVAAQGFQMGQRGDYYNGVCPAGMDTLFLEGYQQGQALKAKLDAIAQLTDEIGSSRNKIEKLNATLKEKKQLLISSNTSEKDRVILLDEVESLQSKIYDTENKLHWAKKEKEQRERELDKPNQIDRY